MGRKAIPRKIRELGGRVHAKKTEPLMLEQMKDDDLTEDIFKGLPAPALSRAKRALAMLRKIGVLDSCDAEPFCRYCQHLKNAYNAQEIVDRDGVLSVDQNGNIRKHPAIQIHRDNSLAALRYEEQFGLTPSARARLAKPEQIAEDREVSDFADFLEDK